MGVLRKYYIRKKKSTYSKMYFIDNRNQFESQDSGSSHVGQTPLRRIRREVTIEVTLVPESSSGSTNGIKKCPVSVPNFTNMADSENMRPSFSIKKSE